jgi:hypothetical protein
MPKKLRPAVGLMAFKCRTLKVKRQRETTQITLYCWEENIYAKRKIFAVKIYKLIFQQEIWLNKEIIKVWVDSTVWVKKLALLSSLFIDLKE